jgi:hypothetical protein
LWDAAEMPPSLKRGIAVVISGCRASFPGPRPLRHILTKLGFRSRAQVAAWAAEQGLLEPDPR